MKRRTSQQREVILQELRGMRAHPTAQELYEVVRKRLPRISLGTVYRNLDLLVTEGVAERLEIGRGQARYDGRVEEHQHIHCISCGRIDDIDMPSEPWTSLVPARLNGYEVTQCRIELLGRCPDCARGEPM